MSTEAVENDQARALHAERAAALPQRLLIGRDFVDETPHPRIEHINPSTGLVQADVPSCGPVEIDRAVEAARAALPAWRALPGHERRRLLQQLARHVAEDADTIGTICTLEAGHLYSQFVSHYVASWIDYYAGWADRIHGDVIEVYPASGLDYTLPEPVGVVAQVLTWNGPFGFIGMGAAPALAAGCTVVIKAPEQAPFSPLRFGELCLEAGLPPGVVNVVTGDRAAGEALVSHPGVAKISFTGGPETGRAIQRAAARQLTPAVMELGGKSANLVFADADLPAAIESACRFVSNAGQGCSLPTRLLVERSVYDEVLSGVVDAVSRLVVGDPFEAGVDIGPLINEAALERILGMIRVACDRDGAKLLTGGERVGGALAQGFFMRPTVLSSVRSDSEIAQREVFGPVLVAMPFDDEAEAVAIANDTAFGLAAYVQTRDVSRAHRLARALEAGTVHVNGSGPGPAGPPAPFGGIKDSGYGRQGGLAGVQEFLAVKNVLINM